MTYKSLLIHVEPNDAGRERLRAAVEIAHTLGARLIGVGARALNAMPDPIGISVVKLREETQSDLARAELLFEEEARSLGSASLWRAEIDFPTQVLLRHASAADLIVSGRWIEAHPAETKAGTADLVMGAGIPVLVLPDKVKLDFTRIVIAWKDTREARRAIWDALPLLKRADDVRVLRFTGHEQEMAPGISDVVERLRLHGVTAKPDVRKRTERSVVQDLLAAADEIGAGLIVAGGYGHSRLREWVLGGVTQGLLHESSKCILFSH
jgi:nucleotide-binding universal stress UspA family protein